MFLNYYKKYLKYKNKYLELKNQEGGIGDVVASYGIGYMFMTPEQLKMYEKISEAKKGKPVWNTGKIMEKFICSICGKQVGGKGNLVQHKNKHLPN